MKGQKILLGLTKITFLSFLFLLFCHPDAKSSTLVAKTPKSFNVILITADTLRSDFLSVNGYPHPITPNLDKFAKQSYNFTRAYSTGSRTNISIASIHKALYTNHLNFSFYPYVNLKIRHHYKVNKKYPPLYTNVVDKDAHLSLADILNSYSYQTAAFVDGGGYAYFEKPNGYLKGFQKIYNVDKKNLNIGSILVRKKFRKFITSRKKNDSPFFSWIHFMEVHSPYRNSYKGKHFSKGRIGRYEGALNFLDREIGKLLRFIKQKGLFKNSIIIFSADHGEGLGQHNTLYHVENIYEELVKVPLIIYAPKSQKGTYNYPVSIVDIVPSILNLLNINVNGIKDDNNNIYKLDGKSLVFLLKKKNTKIHPSFKKRTVYLDTFDSWERLPKPTKHLKGLVNKDYKYIKNVLNGKEYFFHLSKDPKEKYNLIFKLKNKKFAAKMKKDYKQYIYLKKKLQNMK